MKQNIDFHTISLTGRLCYLFMCYEQYLTTCYPEKDWTLVAQKCWQWTSHYWNEGCDIFSQIIPAYLFEFDNYEQTKKQFDTNLTKSDYEQFLVLYKDVFIDEINALFLLGITFNNVCECSNFSQADEATIDILIQAQKILLKHHIPFPDNASLSDFSVNQKNGWGDFLDSSYLSIIL